MNELIVKEFQNAQVRIVLVNNKEWFVAKDIAELLGYANTRKAIIDHCKKSLSYGDLLGSNESLPPVINGSNKIAPLDLQIKLIFEPDVWRLVIKSRLPEAEKIENWLFEEVLPSIRKTGSYTISEKIEDEKPSIPKIKEMTDLGIELVKLANAFGFQGNQAYLSADKGVRNITGFSPLALLENIHLQAESKSKTLTPTQIGKEIGKSPMETNLILADLEFQEKIGKEWHLLEKGLEFAELLDTNKKHSDGTPVKQIKWKREVIKIVREKSLEIGGLF